MPTSTGYEIASDSSYRWNGRQRGQTPFAVIQHTLSGAGPSRVRTPAANRRARRDDARRHPSSAPILDRGRRTLGVLLARDHRPGGAAPASRDSRRRRTGVPVAARDDRAARRHEPRLARRQGEGGRRSFRDRLCRDDGALRRSDGRRRRDARGARPPSIDRVLAHVRRHLDEPLDVQTLADLAGLSRAHFSRVFTDLRRRLARRVRARPSACGAPRACSSAARPASRQVSRDCGFEDPNYFAKAFRRSFGASPTEFRTTGMYADRARRNGG